MFLSKSKLIPIVFLFLSIVFEGFGQATNNYIPNIIQPSPNASSLMKFADVPVSTYTGTANVSIPMYTIQARGISVPIGLDYNTSGIKLKEEAGWVGLGWSLSAGGMISRTIMDKDDFGGEYFGSPVPDITGNPVNQMNYSIPFYPGSPANALGLFGYLFYCNDSVYTDQGTKDFTQALSNSAPVSDFEPDIYRYNFLGRTGKFIINRSGKVIIQKQENIRVSYAADGSSFTIIDDQGNKYYFLDKEYTKSSAGGPQATSSWLLSKVITQLNDTVKFNYYTDNTWTSVPGDPWEVFRTGCAPNNTNGNGTTVPNLYLNLTLQTIDFANGQVQFSFDNVRTDLSNGFKLNGVKIYSKDATGALTYVKEHQLFYSYFNSGQTIEFQRLRLDSVKEVSGTSIIPPYSFLYNIPISGNTGKHSYYVDHWGYSNGYNNNYAQFTPGFDGMFSTTELQSAPGFVHIDGANREPDSASMKAFSLQMMTYPTGGYTTFQYEPNFYDNDVSHMGPEDIPQTHLVDTTFAFAIQAKGNSSGSIDLSNIFLTGFLDPGQIKYSVAFKTLGKADTSVYRNNNGHIWFNWNSTNVDMWQPSLSCGGPVCTTGSQDFKVNSQGVYNWTAYIDPTIPGFDGIYVSISWVEDAETHNKNSTFMAGGLRIKTITDYSAPGVVAKQRRYDYGYTANKNSWGTTSYSYGKLMSIPNYARYEQTVDIIPQTTPFYCATLTRTSGSNTALNSEIQGNIVGYDQVSEYVVDPVTGHDIGKTVYTYSNTPDMPIYYHNFRLPGLVNFGNNLNGLLASKTVYRNNNNTYYKVSEIDNTYHTTNRTVYLNMKYAYIPMVGTYVTGCPHGNVPQFIACLYPSIQSEKILQDQSTEIVYDQSDPSKYTGTNKYFFYDNPAHYQVTRTSFLDSKNNNIVTQLKYPQDYASGNTVIDSLVGRNMVSAVIEKRDSIYIGGSPTGYVKGAQLNLYRPLSSNSMGLDKQYQLSLQAVANDFQGFSFNNNVTSLDARYRQMISFDSYDNLNNIQQYTSTDLNPVSYIWDYKHMYPIAQVKNAAQADVAYTSFEADGTGNWSISGSGAGGGGGASSQVSVMVNAAATTSNIFTTQTPVSATENDFLNGSTPIQGIETGVRFSSSVAGTITGIRFYKTTGNSGTHIGELYSSTGTRLAQATFTGETATGWQTVTFSTPVSISAGTSYIAAYFSTSGYYVGDLNYFRSVSITNGPLTAPADGTNGGIGTDPGNAQAFYLYTATPAVPNQIYESTNYWVDVVFSNGGTPVANAGNNQSITLPASTFTLSGSASTGAITSYLWTQLSGPGSSVITNPSASTTTITGFVAGTYIFQLSINGGASVSQVSVVVSSGGTPVNIFTTQTTTAITGNDFLAGGTTIQGIETGVRFSSSVAGTITGIRFYKTTGNSGAHIGELYSSTGTRLAQATFTGETATGWQTVTFSTPVSITAGTSYIAAYFSSAGNYISDLNYFRAVSITNGPLTAPADGTNGGIGTDPGNAQAFYLYTTTPALPNQIYESSNYWVDVVFVSGSGSSLIPNAGSNQTITLPTSSITLNGSGSTGTITSYLWTKVSGPGNPTIVSPTSASTVVNGLTQGTYVFQLSLNGGSSPSNGFTGTKSYSLSSGSISKNGLTSGKKYIVSYWSSGGANTISGGTYTTASGKSINGWTYYEHVITMSSGTLTITGGNYVDELRLYPSDAQMTTYTYNPLVGITGSCDVDNRASYYQYDSLGRLIGVKDQDGNLIKTIQYYFTSQIVMP